METGVVNNLKPNSNTKERSILSVVFFNAQLQIQEQQNFGASVLNHEYINITSKESSSEYYAQIGDFFKHKISNNWSKVFALIPAENHLLIPTIFYDDKYKSEYFKRSNLHFSGDIKSSKPVNTNSQLLYTFSHKLEMFLHNNFPGIEIYADVHWLINHCMLSNKDNYVLALHDLNELKIVVKKDGALQLVNTFPTENTDEILYYLGYILKGIWPDSIQSTSIVLHGNEEHLDLERINVYFSEVEFHSTANRSTMLQLLSECV